MVNFEERFKTTKPIGGQRWKIDKDITMYHRNVLQQKLNVKT